ncbi:hypothetical protein K8I61_02135 [bacterium]|nr:hypothetical protein [bacterium]
MDERCVFDEVNGEWVGVEAQYDDYCNCISYCEGYRYSSYGECQLDTEIVCPSCGDDDLDDDATNDDSANDDDDTGTPVDDDDDNADSGGACGC